MFYFNKYVQGKANMLPSDGVILLAADVGGTKTALTRCKVRKNEWTMIEEAIFPSKQFDSLADVIRHFQNGKSMPVLLSIAFAGPVQNGKAVATNLGWSVDAAVLARELDIPQVMLINDLEAAAYGLALLPESDLQIIHPAVKAPAISGNAAIIAPGTGLGEAGLFWDGAAFHPFATEGGHSDVAPRNEFDWELLQFLQKQYGPHVSWERLISGPGIFQIYRFLHEVKKWPAAQWAEEHMDEMEPAAAISLGAQHGDATSIETLQLFVRYLAIEASNLALKLKANGGIYLGGGILPKIWNADLQAVFLEHFFEVGRLKSLLEQMPIYLVLNQQAALLGAVYYGAINCAKTGSAADH